MHMRKLAIILAALLLLTACGNDPEATTAPEFPSVPNDCTKTKILPAFPERIPNAKFIETDWEPAEGTDLYAAYNAGGIACSYGIQEAEVGATILWAPDNQILFNERSAEWLKAGQQEVDLPDFNEEKAYFLTQGVEGEGEYIIWAINYLIDGVWIQVGATFFTSLAQAMPLIKAAYDSLRTPKQAANSNVKGCYMAELPEDLYVFNIDYHENNTISAGVYYKNINTEGEKGVFVGSYTNGVVTGTYNFNPEDINSERKLVLKGDKKGFQTVGEAETINYIPAEDCQVLLRQ